MREASGKEPPRVAVVICSKDRHAGLEEAVAHVRSASYPRERAEIVVVEEEGSGAGSIPLVRYVPLPRLNKGLGYARNVGVSHVDLNRTDLVAFCDDDEVVDVNWLWEIVRPFEDPAVFGAGGLVRCRESGAWHETQEILGIPGGGLCRLADESAEEIVATQLLSGANFAYRSAVFKEFRFPENTELLRGQAEDFLMARDVGQKHRLVFNPKAIVYHEPRPSAWALSRTYFVRQKRDYVTRLHFLGQGRFKALFWKGPQLLLLRAILAAALVVWIGFPGLIAVAAFYYGAALYSVRRLFKFVRKKRSFLLYPGAKLLADLGVLAGEWVCLGQLRRGSPPLKL